MLYQRGLIALLLVLLLVGCAGSGAPAPAVVPMPDQAVDDMMMEAGEAELDRSFDEAGGLAAEELALSNTGNQQQLQRLIIKNANLDLRVEDVTAAADQVSRIANEVQGFVVSSGTSGTEDRLTALITIRVPADRFEETLSRLEGLADRVLSRSVSGEDVTEEYVDLEARLRNLEATRDRLLDLLDEATRVQDALEVNQALSDVQGQIEQLQGRLRYLEQSAALSTINISLVPVPTTQVVTEDGWQPVEVARGALRDLLGFAQGLGNLLIVLLIWSPVLLVVGLAGWRGMRFVSNRTVHRKPAATTPNTPNPSPPTPPNTEA